jgi:putative ABC transport system substrate-binding protein
LNEIIPGPAAIGVLLNPGYPDAERELREAQEAAGAINRQIISVRAVTASEIDSGFATLAEQRVSAVLVTSDALFVGRRAQLVALAAHYRLPAMYVQREFAEAGGLISYATDFGDGYRQIGVYVGKIFKGAKPADLPVLQPIKFELIINLKTANALGVTIPHNLLVLADEVIE